MKRFKILTLVDITETKQNRKEVNKEFEYQQQQNFTMLIQAIGMRVNPQYNNSPVITEEDVKHHKFGSAFKGTHKVWSWDFYIEFDGGFTDENGDEAGLLRKDLDLIPVIANLNETATFEFPVFNINNPASANTYILVV